MRGDPSDYAEGIDEKSFAAIMQASQLGGLGLSADDVQSVLLALPSRQWQKLAAALARGLGFKAAVSVSGLLYSQVVELLSEHTTLAQILDRFHSLGEATLQGMMADAASQGDWRAAATLLSARRAQRAREIDQSPWQRISAGWKPAEVLQKPSDPPLLEQPNPNS